MLVYLASRVKQRINCKKIEKKDLRKIQQNEILVVDENRISDSI